MKASARQVFVGFIILIMVALIVWVVWPRKDVHPPTTSGRAIAPDPRDIESARDQGPGDTGPGVDIQPADVPRFVKRPAGLPALLDMPAAEALAAVERGLEMAGDGALLEARAALSQAMLSGRLPEAQAAQAVKALEELADATIFSRVAHNGDPYTGYHTFKPGQILTGPNGVVRKLSLRVPEVLIVRINGLAGAEKFQAGKAYKIIHGPFHAIVHKGKFVMDLYLQREDLPAVFVRRVPVGIGKNGSTPLGPWQIAPTGKGIRVTWYPPPSSPVGKSEVHYNDPDYAFGDKGMWIPLKGMDETTAPLSGYGIHSTNDPGSIGTESSLGCIRLADDHIELVYSLLYPVHSTVETRP